MPGPPSAIRRRRVLVLLSFVALVALILWLLSDSLFRPESGGGGDDRGGGARPQTPVVGEDQDPGPSVQDGDAPTDDADAARTDAYLTAMQLHAEALTEDALPEDLFGALEALDRVRTGRSGGEREELDRAIEQLQSLLRAGLGSLVGDGGDGQLHIQVAARTLAGYSGAAFAGTRVFLDRALKDLSLPASRLRADLGDFAAPPDPVDRPTIDNGDGSTSVATRAKGASWTFRGKTGFVRWARYECEWIGAGETADAALDQCSAAIRAGDAAYAIAWFGRALQRGADPERLDALRARFTSSDG